MVSWYESLCTISKVSLWVTIGSLVLILLTLVFQWAIHRLIRLGE